MFDRPPVSPHDSMASSADFAPQSDADPAQDNGVERLCAAYDALIAGGAELSEEAATELTGMAGIYDLDTDRPHAEIWRDLRAVLVRQAPQQPAGSSEPVLGAASTEAQGDDAVAPAPAPVADHPLTLLLVEDDPEMAADLTATLSEAGHSIVGPFHDGAAAEAAAGLHAIDLALLDINLSGDMTGVDLAQTLKSRWDVPVLFLTGDVTTAARHADLAEALVLKPYTGRDVLDAVARAARSPAGMGQAGMDQAGSDQT